MRIGELLIMNGLLNEEQLNEALQEQTFRPGKLGEIIVGKGFITERQLVEALEFQLGIPVAGLSESIPELAAASLIPDTLARKHLLVPLGKSGSKLKVAMADPADSEAIREVELATGQQVKAFIAARSEVVKAIARCYGEEDRIRPLDEIIATGLEWKASYLHIEASDGGVTVKARVDRGLRTMREVPEPLSRNLVQEIRRLSGLKNPGNDLLPQTGRFTRPTADGTAVHVQVSALQGAGGESMVLRLIAGSDYTRKLPELELGESQLQKLEQALEHTSGLVLVAGPPGSGKTTMQYAFLHHLAHEERKIISLEDPVERTLPGITQVEIQDHTGLTCAFGLRSSLRQDPNILMVGEIRDRETAGLAMRAALSERLVIGGVPGTSPMQVLDRLADWGLEHHQIGSALKAVVVRRLLRRVCKQCAQSVPVTDEDARVFEEAGLLPSEDPKNGNKGLFGNFRSIVSAQMTGKMTVLRGNGCRLCGETGYRGVIAVQEVLTVDEPLQRMLLEKRPSSDIQLHLEQSGHKTMRYDALSKVREGLTTLEEVRKADIGPN